ncbi:uncharacterized protein LOC100376854 [Saccoglossus kowalevskii]|uniref:Serine/arginine repetitive matrix protein 2-like n=1 Tax=Saccoglossus kowalevskii TaxID=10224 RepID=A0ABM0GJ37_SACKO|nr:PREDICTED: serine/arginine repetitive matrix protein 2-like [Saccoglossus kowalevskii]
MADPDTEEIVDPYSVKFNTKWEATPIRGFKSNVDYIYAMKEDLAEWFNDMYNLDLTVETFLEKLESGIVLCQHANNVHKAAVEYRRQFAELAARNGLQIPETEIRYKPLAPPGTFMARDNISNFITWCRHSLGVKDVLLFETDDLVLRKNEKSFVLCLLEVARRGAKFGMESPTIIQMEAEIDAEISGGPKSEICVQKKNFDLMSLDELVRDLVNRCTCPVQFRMIEVSQGKYRIGDFNTLIFVRILRSHVMVRVGGGWDTLEHYLDKHDPCRCAGHKAARLHDNLRRQPSPSGSDMRSSRQPRTTQECDQSNNKVHHHFHSTGDVNVQNGDTQRRPSGEKSYRSPRSYRSTSPAPSYGSSSSTPMRRSGSVGRLSDERRTTSEDSYNRPSAYTTNYTHDSGSQSMNSSLGSSLRNGLSDSTEFYSKSNSVTTKPPRAPSPRNVTNNVDNATRRGRSSPVPNLLSPDSSDSEGKRQHYCHSSSLDWNPSVSLNLSPYEVSGNNTLSWTRRNEAARTLPETPARTSGRSSPSPVAAYIRSGRSSPAPSHRSGRQSPSRIENDRAMESPRRVSGRSSPSMVERNRESGRGSPAPIEQELSETVQGRSTGRLSQTSFDRERDRGHARTRSTGRSSPSLFDKERNNQTGRSSPISMQESKTFSGRTSPGPSSRERPVRSSSATRTGSSFVERQRERKEQIANARSSPAPSSSMSRSGRSSPSPVESRRVVRSSSPAPSRSSITSRSSSVPRSSSPAPRPASPSRSSSYSRTAHKQDVNGMTFTISRTDDGNHQVNREGYGEHERFNTAPSTRHSRSVRSQEERQIEPSATSRRAKEREERELQRRRCRSVSPERARRREKEMSRMSESRDKEDKTQYRYRSKTPQPRDLEKRQLSRSHGIEDGIASHERQKSKQRMHESMRRLITGSKTNNDAYDSDDEADDSSNSSDQRRSRVQFNDGLNKSIRHSALRPCSPIPNFHKLEPRFYMPPRADPFQSKRPTKIPKPVFHEKGYKVKHSPSVNNSLSKLRSRASAHQQKQQQQPRARSITRTNNSRSTETERNTQPSSKSEIGQQYTGKYSMHSDKKDTAQQKPESINPVSSGTNAGLNTAFEKDHDAFIEEIMNKYSIFTNGYHDSGFEDSVNHNNTVANNNNVQSPERKHAPINMAPALVTGRSTIVRSTSSSSTISVPEPVRPITPTLERQQRVNFDELGVYDSDSTDTEYF